MKYLYFLLSLSLIIFISCQSDRENQPVSPSEEDVEIIENAIFHDIINANSHIAFIVILMLLMILIALWICEQ